MQQPKKKKRPFITKLNTVSRFHDLPDYEPIQSFLNYLKCNAEVESLDHLKQCYTVSSDLKQAYFIVSLCFGGLQAIDYIAEKQSIDSFNIQQKEIKYLEQMTNQFNWSERVPAFTIFKQNAKKLGQRYPILYQIFNKAKLNECESLFKFVKSKSKFLSGVKIRKWGKEGKQSSYREQQRQHEKAQRNYVNGNTYLIIAETGSGTYNIGIIEIEEQFDSECHTLRNSIVDKQFVRQQNRHDNASQKAISITHPQTIPSISPINNPSFLVPSEVQRSSQSPKRSFDPLRKDQIISPNQNTYNQQPNKKTKSFEASSKQNQIWDKNNQFGIPQNRNTHDIPSFGNKNNLDIKRIQNDERVPVEQKNFINKMQTNKMSSKVSKQKSNSFDIIDSKIYDKPQASMIDKPQFQKNQNYQYVRIQQKQKLHKDAQCPCCQII